MGNDRSRLIESDVEVDDQTQPTSEQKNSNAAHQERSGAGESHIESDEGRWKSTCWYQEDGWAGKRRRTKPRPNVYTKDEKKAAD